MVDHETLHEVLFSREALLKDAEDEEFWRLVEYSIRWVKQEKLASMSAKIETGDGDLDRSAKDYMITLESAYSLMKLGMLALMGIEEKSAMVKRETARMAALVRADSDPKVQAMRQIKNEWEAMQNGETVFHRDAKFARMMAAKYPVIESESSIKNAISRWRKGLRTDS